MILCWVFLQKLKSKRVNLKLLALSDAVIKWEMNGKTVVVGNGPGSALNQLNSSDEEFVNADDALFAVDLYNHRGVK